MLAYVGHAPSGSSGRAPPMFVAVSETMSIAPSTRLRSICSTRATSPTQPLKLAYEAVLGSVLGK